MSSFTKEQKEKYLANPDQCPFCKSESLRWEFQEFVGLNEAKVQVICKDCNKSFFEYYILQDIETGKE
jgi:hypothetical protein